MKAQVSTSEVCFDAHRSKVLSQQGRQRFAAMMTHTGCESLDSVIFPWKLLSTSLEVNLRRLWEKIIGRKMGVQ